MSFASVLNSYCSMLGCTNKVIAEKCGISASALSRYRNGERTPDLNGDVIDRLVTGINELSLERGIAQSSNEEVFRKALENSLASSSMLGMSFAARVDALVNFLGMKNSEAAECLGVSQSYISRIRNGQRMPGGYPKIAQRLSQAATMRCLENGLANDVIDLVSAMGGLVDRSQLKLDSYADLSDIIEQWLLGNNIFDTDVKAVDELLDSLNSLYFLDWFEAIINGPSIPAKQGTPEPKSLVYYGLEQILEAEIDFFEIAAAYRAKRVVLSSEIPLLEMPLANDHLNRFLPSVSTIIGNKGQIIVLHSGERPLVEATILIKDWLPLYLTGAVSPYYLRGASGRLFNHVNYACDVCALSSEAMRGHPESGRAYLSTLPEDVTYYNKKLDYTMEYVTPLLDVYQDSVPGDAERFREFMANCEKTGTGNAVAQDGYDNLDIVSFEGNCAIVSITCGSPIHFVIYHPKLSYVISHL